MQLTRPPRGRLVRGTWLALAATSLTAAVTLPARAAEVEASQRVTLFQEPSSSNAGITVLHPQTDVAATLASTVTLAAGYELDVVTGATPSVFGVDAITQATKFSDTRQQAHAAVTYVRPVADVTVGYSYGWEHDYKSSALTVTTRSDVFDHVFTVGLSYTHNFDDVCDQNNVAASGRPLDRIALASSSKCFTSDPSIATQHLNIDSLEPSLTWAATPRLLLQSGGTIQVLDGFQANPYRRVQLGSAMRTPQESLPHLRQRFALFGRTAYAIPRIRASLQGTVRIYRDTWAVESVSAELLAQQYLLRSLIISVRGRVHSQRGASFYRDAEGYRLFGPTGQYWTGDRELSPMKNLLGGLKLAYVYTPENPGKGSVDEVEASFKWEGLFYHLDSAFAPNADRKLALIWQAAVSLRF